MKISEILASIETSVKSTDERTYFLIHEARYKKILEEIVKIKQTGVTRTRASHDETSLRSENKIMDRANSFRDRIEANRGTRERQDPDKTKYKILDVGCFPYHIGAALEKMGHEVWGISSFHEPINNKRVAILNIETDTFPYKNNFFDLILCSEVVEHLPQSPIPALKEMYRVAKPGGHILITTPNISRSINQGKMLLGKSPVYSIDAFLENQGKGSNLYHRHNREFTLHELTKLTKHAGWQINKATHFVSYTPFRRRNRKDNPLLWTGKFANFLAMKAIPRLADTLLVVAHK